MSSNEGDPSPWTSVAEVVDALGLAVEPSDVDAVRKAVLDGMKRSQNTRLYRLWVSAYEFVTAEGGTDLPILAPRHLVASTQTTATALAPYQQRVDESLSDGIALIQRSTRRFTITLGVATTVLMAVWAFPSQDNPLLKQFSPYQEVRDAFTEETELVFNHPRTYLWMIVVTVAALLWILALLRHTFQVQLVSNAHEPTNHALSLSSLRTDKPGGFTKSDFEEALIVESSPRSEVLNVRWADRLPPKRRVRVARAAAAGAAGVALIGITDPAYGGRSLLPLAVIAAAPVTVMLLAISFFLRRRTLSPTRSAAFDALSATGAKEELRRAVRSASDLALECFVERRTLAARPDIDFLPSYVWVEPADTSLAGGEPSG